jgi:hypothetical protein
MWGKLQHANTNLKEMATSRAQNKAYQWWKVIHSDEGSVPSEAVITLHVHVHSNRLKVQAAKMDQSATGNK